MRERSLESSLVRKAKLAGGVALKWVSPGTVGVPDRIVFLPGGRVVFVEMKAPGKWLTPIQEHVATKLSALGAEVRCISSVEELNEFLS